MNGLHPTKSPKKSLQSVHIFEIFASTTDRIPLPLERRHPITNALTLQYMYPPTIRQKWASSRRMLWTWASLHPTTAPKWAIPIPRTRVSPRWLTFPRHPDQF
jgi:hypothetical protein